MLEVPRRQQSASESSRTSGLPHAHGRTVGSEAQLNTGTVTKIVRSYGASWGRIAVEGGQLTFFNESSFADPDDFDSLQEGAAVSFKLTDDPVNGSRAVAIELVPGALQATGSES